MKPLPPGITPAMMRCLQRSTAAPGERFAAGQWSTSARWVDIFLLRGWWEVAGQGATSRGGITPRYKITPEGLKVAKEHAP